MPGPDASQEWILLTHAPHTRVGPQPYTIGALVGMGLGGGLAGQLRYAGEPVAAVVDVGALARTAPAAQLTATTGRFDTDDWHAFVTAARCCGEPMTEAAVLEALAVDTLLGMEVAEAVAAGGAVARLVDDTGTVLHVDRVRRAPATPEAFRAYRTGCVPATDTRAPPGSTGTATSGGT